MYTLAEGILFQSEACNAFSQKFATQYPFRGYYDFNKVCTHFVGKYVTVKRKRFRPHNMYTFS